MSHVELFELIEKLRAAGITHFKQGDLELTFSDTPTKIEPRHLQSVPLEKQATGEAEEAPHIVQEMKSLLKLSDEELVERIFPIEANDKEESA